MLLRLTGLLLVPLALLAVDFNLNPFGTFGASATTSDQVEFNAYGGQRGGTTDGELDWTTNTILGAQGEIRLTDRLSLTGQGVARQHGEDDFGGILDWAYLAYQPGYDLTLRAGKFRMPIFQSTQLAYVGYARTWARPPLPFYGAGGYNNYDGAEVLYNGYVGDYDYALHYSYGVSDMETPKAPTGAYSTAETEDMQTLVFKFGDPDFWLSVAYLHAKSEVKRHMAGGEIREESATLNTLTMEGERRYAGFEFRGGYGKTTLSEGILPDEELVYLSVAYPLEEEALTPYLLFSEKSFLMDKMPTPPPGQPQRPDGMKESVYSLGVRYDWRPGIALKFQYDRLEGDGYELVKSTVGNAPGVDSVSADIFTGVIDVAF